MANGWGGRRPGAGRPRGSRSKATLLRERLIQREARGAHDELPLELLLRVMRNARLPRETRMLAARWAAPYVHPRLQAVSQTGTAGQKTYEEWLAEVRPEIDC